MTLDAPSARLPESAESSREAAWRFLKLSARLLLQYNMRAALLTHQIGRLARHLDIDVLTTAAYRELTLASPDGRSFHIQTPELRINASLVVETLNVIDDLCASRIGLDDAMRRLEAVERTTPRYGRWMLVVLFALGGSALAWLLRADTVAVIVSGLSSGAGVVARQQLGSRRVVFLAQPFTAGLIGALLGGLTVRLGWTGSAGLCLVVPALMLVPGPHLINGVQDVLENNMASGLGRLSLAAAILLAAAIGVLIGAELTVGLTPGSEVSSSALPLTLSLDVLLAGVAACSFGAFYNTPRQVLWVSIVCGMVGHGLRYVCLEQGLTVDVATLVGCVAVGAIGNTAANRLHLPFASVAFAGAVPMMPGVFIYQSIAGAARLAIAGTAADASMVAATAALSSRAAFVVGAIALGLLIGASLTARLTDARQASAYT
jgi:uncharacterized membrane protein YjjP (DUF1212 family)